MPTLEDIIKDSTYSDEDPILVKGVEYKMGDLRKKVLNLEQFASKKENEGKERLTAVQKKEQELQEREMALGNFLLQIQNDPTGALGPILGQAASGAINGQQGQGQGQGQGQQWWEDPLLKPVYETFNPVIDGYKKQLTEQNQLIQQMANAQNGLVKTFLDFTLSNEFEGIKDRPAELTKDELIRFGMDNALYDDRFPKEYRVPSLKKSYEAKYRDQFLEKERTEMRKKLEAEVRGQSRSDTMFPFGSSGGGGGSAPPSFKNMDEAFAAMKADPSILRS